MWFVLRSRRLCPSIVSVCQCRRGRDSRAHFKLGTDPNAQSFLGMDTNAGSSQLLELFLMQNFRFVFFDLLRLLVRFTGGDREDASLRCRMGVSWLLAGVGQSS